MAEVTVLVDDDHRSRIDDVAQELERAGLRVAARLSATGVITGSLADAGQTAALRQVAGVAAVELARDVRLPPPDAPVQ